MQQESKNCIIQTVLLLSAFNLTSFEKVMFTYLIHELVTAQLSWNKSKTSKYEKIQTILIWALNMPRPYFEIKDRRDIIETEYWIKTIRLLSWQIQEICKACSDGNECWDKMKRTTETWKMGTVPYLGWIWA